MCCWLKRFLPALASLVLIVSSLLGQDYKPPSLTIEAPMRDGTTLPVDLYLPSHASADQRYPCLLVRNPSGRRSEPWIAYSALAEAGYLVAFQDTRSTLDPEGRHIPFWSEGWGNQQDGYDTVEWLAKLPCCNGKVATLGQSAAGITQLLLAPTAPPSLACQYIGTATASLYHDAIYPNGLLQKNLVDGWLKLYAPHPDVHLTVTSQPSFNSFWENFDTHRVVHRVQVPALFYTGWYDTFLQGTLDAFSSRQKRGGEGARGKQKLLIGPWTHYWPAQPGLSSVKLPPHALQPPEDLSPIRWFDHYLKGIPNGADQIPAVTYYIMGPFDGTASSGHRWATTESWPPPHTPTPFYLTAERKLELNLSKSGKREDQKLTFSDNPEKPVQTLGGNNLFIESGPIDQRPLETTEQILLFTSDPLEEELILTGPLSATLYVTSNQPQAAVVLRLTDLYPDGKSLLIAEAGATFHSKTADEPVKVDINLGATGIAIPKGHAVRLIISGSSLPRYIVQNYGATANPHGRAVPNIAEHRIYLEGKNASSLLLPVATEQVKSSI